MNAKSIAIASAAATLFLTGAVAARAEDKMGGEQVRCAGINACKGQSMCASGKDGCMGKNGCMGQNACKGQGMTMTSPEDCKAKGGTVAPEKR